MRLVDKKRKDYYDSLQGLDREPEPLFIRSEKTIEYNTQWDRLYLPWLSYKPEHYPVVGFCGRLFPAYISDKWLFKPEEIPCQNAQQQRQVERQFAAYGSYKEPWPIFISYHYRDRTEVVLNPLLNHTGFQRIIDPFTAWQELRVFLSNIAVPEKPIAEVSDEIKIQAHGFDKKSFRKEKQ